jgi:hypothetical protein
MNKDIRCIYVYGNPIEAVVSLFNRGYHHWQSSKLQRHLRDVVQPIPSEYSLEDYVREGKDCFLFREHFYNYYENLTVHPTLFINYEKIWAYKKEIIRYLKLPKNAILDFPEKKKRHSSEAGLSELICSGLFEIYGTFKAELEELPDIVLRGEEYLGMTKHVASTENYRIASLAESFRTARERKPDAKLQKIDNYDIDYIRDLAVSYEKTNINFAYELMSIALKYRPHGPFIKKKVKYYEKQL